MLVALMLRRRRRRRGGGFCGRAFQWTMQRTDRATTRTRGRGEKEREREVLLVHCSRFREGDRDFFLFFIKANANSLQGRSHSLSPSLTHTQIATRMEDIKWTNRKFTFLY